jgi:hypothetical protein
MRIKHSKYKNTGILFELLVRQIASDTISGKDSPAVGIIRKYFGKTELMKEHKLYQTIINSKILSEGKAESLVNATLDLYSRLNRTNLRKEKYNLISEIKEHYDIEEFFKAKINYYKEYAAIYNLMEVKISKEFIEPNQIAENRITLLEHVSKSRVNKDDVEDRILEEYVTMDKGTRLLTYRILLEKFNSKYQNLSGSQKLVLKEFINNITNTTKLREFINEQYVGVKKDLIILTPKIDNKITKIKVQEIINLIQPLGKTQNAKDDDIITLLQYHQLIADLKSAN